MKISYLFFSFSLFFSSLLHSQSQESIDKLTVKVCKVLKKNDVKKNPEKLKEALTVEMTKFSEKNEITDKEVFIKKFYFRLQKNCAIFSELMTENMPTSDWSRLEKKAKTNLSKTECSVINDQSKYIYREANNDSTYVLLKDDLWVETFKDKTFSKLHFKWISDCSFELEFIESNNVTRENLSIPGDIYKYTVLSKEDGYYLVMAHVDSQKGVYYTFKLYY